MLLKTNPVLQKKEHLREDDTYLVHLITLVRVFLSFVYERTMYVWDKISTMFIKFVAYSSAYYEVLFTLDIQLCTSGMQFFPALIAEIDNLNLIEARD